MIEIDKVELSFLYKLLYQFKFLDIESSPDYDEIVYSPIYGKLFSKVKNELEHSGRENSIDSGEDMSVWLKKFPDQKSRIIKLIEVYEESRELTGEEKKQCLDSLRLPFRLTLDEEVELLSYFK